jgi:CubicO group peptidase (beta-lactamase class C family)
MFSKNKYLPAKFLVIGLLVYINVNAQTEYKYKTLQIDSILNKCLEKEIFNGVALVADNGKIILNKGYGVSDYKSKSDLNVNDRFYIGSMTKQFTSMLIYILHEKEMLNIHDPISKYLPSFRNKLYKNITVYHLLTHSSGIVSYNLLPYFDKANDYSVDEVYELIKATKPIFQSGTRYDYSNSGYYLLGKIAESCSGLTYSELLKQDILIPLGMFNTNFDEHWLQTDLAKGSWMTIDGRQEMPNYSLSTLYASGGIYSNTIDLFKWNEALYTSDLISDSLKYVMFTPFINDYASGWRVNRGLEDSVYFERHQHGGIIQGYHTFILRRVPQKQVVILLDNFYNQEIQSIKNSIWSVLEERKGWVPKPLLSALLYKSIVEGTIDSTLKLIEENRWSYIDEFDFDEYDVNIVGYRLLNVGRLSEAKRVFKFNVYLYPNAWNVYDSYGEVLLLMNELTESKEMYKKSLELNSENTSAIIRLKEIEELLHQH